MRATLLAGAEHDVHASLKRTQRDERGERVGGRVRAGLPGRQAGAAEHDRMHDVSQQKAQSGRRVGHRVGAVQHEHAARAIVLHELPHGAGDRQPVARRGVLRQLAHGLRDHDARRARSRPCLAASSPASARVACAPTDSAAPPPLGADRPTGEHEADRRVAGDLV